MAEIELDAAGNVKAYQAGISYLLTGTTTRGDTSTRGSWTRSGSPRSAMASRTGYDDQPGRDTQPYDFVPAVWVQHSPTGDDHGQPGPAQSIQDGRVEQPGERGNGPGAAHPERADPDRRREHQRHERRQSRPDRGPGARHRRPRAIKIVTAGSGASIEAIRLDAGETLEHIDRLIREIEADHPELTMYQQMREMSQITGPAADRLFGDVAALVDAAARAV